MSALTSRVRSGHLASAWVVALMLTGVTFLAACSLSTSGAISASKVADEYLAETQNLEEQGFVLAPGDEWPEPSFPEKAPDGHGVTYGRGTGTQHADKCWFDSWAYLAVTTDDEATCDTAVQQLQRVRETYAYGIAIPETRISYDWMVDEALAGDLTELQQYVTANMLRTKED